MATIYLSNALADAHSIERVVELINAGGTAEGMDVPGGIQFTPAMMAGQWAYEAAHQAGDGVDDGALEAHLEFVRDAGAEFDAADAVAHGMAIHRAQ